MMEPLRKRLNQILRDLYAEFDATTRVDVVAAFPDKLDQITAALVKYGWGEDARQYQLEDLAKTSEGRRILLRYPTEPKTL